MRSALIAMACTACSTPASSPDAPSGFTFTGDYTLQPNITSMSFGSAIYTGGQTLHVQVTYASYAAAMADLEFAEVTAYGFTSSLPIGASCDCANVGDPYADSESDTVEWPLGSNTWWVQGEYTCYYPPNTGPCAGTIN